MYYEIYLFIIDHTFQKTGYMNIGRSYKKE